jgi:hypothetical protein
VAVKKQNETDNLQGVTKRLDAIIRLLLDGQRVQKTDKKITQVDQVLMLHSVGLTDTDIGNIIGQKRNQVASIRTHAKKVKKE